MKLEKMLATIRQSEATPAEKTASDKTTVAPAETKTASANPLEAALKGALAEVNGAEKTASEKGSPVADVMKIASDLADAEKAALELEKQANELYSQGFNDTVEQIHSIAATEFMKAAHITSALIQDARQSA